MKQKVLYRPTNEIESLEMKMFRLYKGSHGRLKEISLIEYTSLTFNGHVLPYEGLEHI